MNRPRVYNDGTGDGLREFAPKASRKRRQEWRIERLDGWNWEPLIIRIDGIEKRFGSRRAAESYWYDQCGPIGRNERARFVRVR